MNILKILFPVLFLFLFLYLSRFLLTSQQGILFNLSPYLVLITLILTLQFMGLYQIKDDLNLTNFKITRVILFGCGVFVVGILGYTVTQTVGIKIKMTSYMDYNPFLLFLIIFASASLEEIFFRGYLLDILGNKFTHSAVPIIVSSLLFAFYHVSVGQLLSTFLIGIALGWIAVRYESIALNIGVHLIYNLLGLAMYLLSNIKSL